MPAGCRTWVSSSRPRSGFERQYDLRWLCRGRTVAVARADPNGGDLMSHSDTPDMPLSPRADHMPALSSSRQPDTLLLRILARAEYLLLYLVSLALLAVGGGVLVLAALEAIHTDRAWTERFIVFLEELLLVLIIVEIFVTVQTHLAGGRLQLEPFIIIGIIALVRHILSIVVRLAVPETAAQTRIRLTELAVDAAAAFLLVAALALARWSLRRSDTV